MYHRLVWRIRNKAGTTPRRVLACISHLENRSPLSYQQGALSEGTGSFTSGGGYGCDHLFSGLLDGFLGKYFKKGLLSGPRSQELKVLITFYLGSSSFH